MIFNVTILKIREHIMEEVKESCLDWRCHLGIVFSFGCGVFGAGLSICLGPRVN